jgi:alpha-D-ribose 1-methylphosphonate 5-phosphate C-P lyase
MPTFSRIARKNVTWVRQYLYLVCSTSSDVFTYQAWITAACFLPISYGWAAGDVSLAAYIQHTLSSMDIADQGVSPLGAVMGEQIA